MYIIYSYKTIYNAKKYLKKFGFIQHSIEIIILIIIIKLSTVQKRFALKKDLIFCYS